MAFKIEEGKKRFLLRLVDLIKENCQTPKSESHEIIDDKENGTGDENNSDDEDIMFFIVDQEEKDLLSYVYFSFFFVISIQRKSFKSQFQYSFLGTFLDVFKVPTRNISGNFIFGYGFLQK